MAPRSQQATTAADGIRDLYNLGLTLHRHIYDLRSLEKPATDDRIEVSIQEQNRDVRHSRFPTPMDNEPVLRLP